MRWWRTRRFTKSCGRHVCCPLCAVQTLCCQPWKYDKKIWKHYIEVSETGELSHEYKQTEEYSETENAKEPRKRRKLSAAPMELGEDGVGASDTDADGSNVEMEQQAVGFGRSTLNNFERF